MATEIESLQNPLIKTVLKLQEKSRERKKQGLFVIEGKREIGLAKESDFDIGTLLFCADYIDEQEVVALCDQNTKQISISKTVYQKIAYRETTEGLIALTKTKNFSLETIQFSRQNPLILVAESIEKPGNIGALLRTADAANVDAVLIANPTTDLYNPNVIRASVGCLFTNQIALASSEEIINFLKEKKIAIYATTLQNSNAYYLEDYTKACAIAVGTEAIGLSETFREAATKNINIPMQGQIDSMNVSVAAAIVIFEAKRQRNFL